MIVRRFFGLIVMSYLGRDADRSRRLLMCCISELLTGVSSVQGFSMQCTSGWSLFQVIRRAHARTTFQQVSNCNHQYQKTGVTFGVTADPNRRRKFASTGTLLQNRNPVFCVSKRIAPPEWLFLLRFTYPCVETPNLHKPGFDWERPPCVDNSSTH